MKLLPPPGAARPAASARLQAHTLPPVSLFKAASTVSLLTLVSRITGLVRELLMASVFGVSAMTDAFNVAFRIPNLFRRVLGEGAFSQAFAGPIAGGLESASGRAVSFNVHRRHRGTSSDTRSVSCR